MIDRKFFAWLEELSRTKAFRDAVALTERARQERYDMELVLRFLVLSRAPETELKGVKDVADFITQGMKKLAADKTFHFDTEKKVFHKVFESLRKVMGRDCFSRPDRGRGRGGFLISVFEVAAVGLGHWLLKQPQRTIQPHKLEAAFDQLWKSSEFKSFSKSGVSASSRLPKLVPLGRRLFNLL
jgi:hypothetical protein